MRAALPGSTCLSLVGGLVVLFESSSLLQPFGQPTWNVVGFARESFLVQREHRGCDRRLPLRVFCEVEPEVGVAAAPQRDLHGEPGSDTGFVHGRAELPK